MSEVDGCDFQADDYDFQVDDYIFQVDECDFQVDDYIFQVDECNFQVDECMGEDANSLGEVEGWRGQMGLWQGHVGAMPRRKILRLYVALIFHGRGQGSAVALEKEAAKPVEERVNLGGVGGEKEGGEWANRCPSPPVSFPRTQNPEPRT